MHDLKKKKTRRNGMKKSFPHYDFEDRSRFFKLLTESEKLKLKFVEGS